MTFVAVTKNIKSMYSSSDFERLFIRYKAEASHGRVYYKDTRHQIVPVQVAAAWQIVWGLIIHCCLHTE